MDESTRFIVITGCTRGLGRVLSEDFHAIGHRVAGCGPQHNVESLRIEDY